MNTDAMYSFCTYFDIHYLQRGLALFASLRRHCAPFRLWVLCMDEPSHHVLKKLDLPEIRPIALHDFEKGDDRLLEAKQNRSTVEYYFTCTPSLPRFILNRHPEVDRITYLDADLFFYSDPAPVFDEINGNSITIIPHRFPEALRSMERRGIYNVGFLSFRRDENAVTCLEWWREKCLKWCYDRVEGDRYADQRYLDDWPTRFHGVRVLEHKGANTGPWNISRYPLTLRDNAVYVDDQPLVFFHFHGLKKIGARIYDPNLTVFRTRLTRTMTQGIYAPYIRALSETTARVAPLIGPLPARNGIRNRPLGLSLRERAWILLDRFILLYRTVLMRNVILIVGKRIF